MSSLRAAWAVVALSLLSSACAGSVPAESGRVPAKECAKEPVPVVVVEDTRPVLVAELPPGFFPPDAPWPTLPRVALAPLDTSKLRQKSVRIWVTSALEERVGEASVNEPSAGLLRGLLFAKPGDPRAPAATYAFQGLGQQRPVYFLEPPRTQNDTDSRVLRGFRRDTLDGRTLYLDVAMLSPGQSKRFPLDRWVHLVDVEVNHGHGEAHDANFAITKLRVLDGTEVLPIDLAAVASALDERAQALFAAASTRAQADVLRAEKKLPADAQLVKRAPNVRSRVGIAWDEPRKELSFTYLYETTSATYQGPTRNLPTNCALNEPCLARTETVAYSVGFAVGVRQTLSANGALVEETTFEPQVRVVPAKRVQGRR